MNYQEIVKSLVLDGHMSYNEVLSLTPYQLAALGAKESSPPGEVSYEEWLKLKAKIEKIEA